MYTCGITSIMYSNNAATLQTVAAHVINVWNSIGQLQPIN